MSSVRIQEKPMIHSTLRIVTDPAKLLEAFAILLSMSERIRIMSGCIVCRVYRDAQEDCSLMFEEIWMSEEDLNMHIRSEEYRNVLLVMEMAVEKPEIRFETVSQVTGMETIEKVRTLA
jgi:quinol monooxygenase YgiN